MILNMILNQFLGKLLLTIMCPSLINGVVLMNYTKTLLGTLGYVICLSAVVYVGSLGILTFAS